MKRIYSYIFAAFILIQSCSLANELTSNQIDSLRNLLYAGIEREAALDSLENLIQKLQQQNDLKSDPLLIAYEGVCTSVEAKYDFWPWDKLGAVKDGLKQLDSAVNLDSTNIEIRFLRFAVLHNIPSILGYSTEAQYDAEFLYALIMNSKNQKDKYLIEKVAEYLINSERLDNNKNKILGKLYNLSLK